MPEHRNGIRLTIAQLSLLGDIADSTYGEAHITPQGRRSSEPLIRHGYLKRGGANWVSITPEGRACVERLRSL